MTPKNGGFCIVVTRKKLGPEESNRDAPDGVWYMRDILDREQGETAWWSHRRVQAMRFRKYEDAIAAMVRVAETYIYSGVGGMRIIPWSRRGKRAMKLWSPK